jgi:hypothetical protein
MWPFDQINDWLKDRASEYREGMKHARLLSSGRKEADHFYYTDVATELGIGHHPYRSVGYLNSDGAATIAWQRNFYGYRLLSGRPAQHNYLPTYYNGPGSDDLGKNHEPLVEYHSYIGGSNWDSPGQSVVSGEGSYQHTPSSSGSYVSYLFNASIRGATYQNTSRATSGHPGFATKPTLFRIVGITSDTHTVFNGNDMRIVGGEVVGHRSDLQRDDSLRNDGFIKVTELILNDQKIDPTPENVTRGLIYARHLTQQIFAGQLNPGQAWATAEREFGCMKGPYRHIRSVERPTPGTQPR